MEEKDLKWFEFEAWFGTYELAFVKYSYEIGGGVAIEALKLVLPEEQGADKW